MATITINIESIKGESTVSGYENQVDALGLRETIELGQSSGGGTGRARQSDVEIIRYKDSASAKLAEACASATSIGKVEINVFRTVDTGAAAYLTYVLTDTYVSRVEQETLDEQHVALRPHLSEMTRGLPLPGAAGLTTALGSTVSEALASSRLMVLPLEQTDAFSNLEVERISLNFNTITWNYVTYVDGKAAGSVQQGFNLATHTPL